MLVEGGSKLEMPNIPSFLPCIFMLTWEYSSGPKDSIILCRVSSSKYTCVLLVPLASDSRVGVGAGDFGG